MSVVEAARGEGRKQLLRSNVLSLYNERQVMVIGFRGADKRVRGQPVPRGHGWASLGGS